MDLERNQLTSVPAEIGQLASLTELRLSESADEPCRRRLGRSPAEGLNLGDNQLTSLPAEIGRSRRWRGWTSAAIS